MYSKILVPLDGSKTAEKVLPYARHLAGKFKIPVELLAVLDIAEMATHISAERARHLDTMIEDGMRASTTYLRGIATTFPAGNVTCTVEKERAEEAIIGNAGADGGTLIAMATHGRSGMDRFLLGSVAEKVLRGSANPLVLVRANEEAKTSGEAPFKSIIVPLDGSELAESVIPLAVTMAQKLDLEVVLFRAYHMPYNAYGGDDGYMVNYDELIDSVRDEAKEYLDKKVAEVTKLGVAKVSALSKEGFAGDEIIALGHKTPDGLIAMCSHGRSGVKRWVLGSVTENVVRHSDAPVLVVRAKQ
ncbi:MAG TPA: universal stress protein [Candidatus Deferrimicrobium sp.]|nr:universal stress protein [Candidatus Deferrimicrobium sp.]